MRLVVQAGPLAGRTFDLTKAHITVGRGDQNEIVLADAAVSRAQCEIRWEAGGYMIEDRNSANGTIVNDQRIAQPYRLQPGDIVRMGQTVLLVETSAGPRGAMGPATVPGGPPADLARGGGRIATRWALFGIAALAIVVVAATGLWSMRSQPQLAIAASPTPAPTTIMATALASLTATALAPSIAPATATLPALQAVTPTRFSNPLWTATPLRTPSATALPSRAYPMPVPTVLLPTPRAIYTTNEPIPFSWIAPEVLRPTEVYRVQVAMDPEFAQMACEIKTRETYVTLPGEGAACTDFWQFGQHYYWRVQIVLRDAPGGEISSGSPVGSVHEFTWAPY